jgi:hypothetical protein
MELVSVTVYAMGSEAVCARIAGAQAVSSTAPAAHNPKKRKNIWLTSISGY